jgi:hypothetical protein
MAQRTATSHESAESHAAKGQLVPNRHGAKDASFFSFHLDRFEFVEFHLVVITRLPVHG